jgi:hypothetical protein
MKIKSIPLDRRPRIPHWRYIALSGTQHPEYSEEFYLLQRFMDDEEYYIDDEDMDSEEYQSALSIYNTPPAKRIVENMLMEMCKYDVIRDTLFYKFKITSTSEVIKTYKKYFFDVDNLNSYEIVRYFESNGIPIPKAPPVGGKFRQEYVAFKNGGDFKIDKNEILNHLIGLSFFRTQELLQYGMQGDEKVIKYVKLTGDMIKTSIDSQGTDSDLPDELQFPIEYPDSVSISVDQLEGYDPHDDPNEK